MKPIVPTSEVDIFFEGLFSEPRLRHPEGIAIDREGNVWCGGEGGRDIPHPARRFGDRAGGFDERLHVGLGVRWDRKPLHLRSEARGGFSIGLNWPTGAFR